MNDETQISLMSQMPLIASSRPFQHSGIRSLEFT